MSRGRHERDYERGRERDSDRSRDYDRERDRDRDRARSRDRGRDRGRDREVSRDYDSGRQRRERESRHGAAETGFGKQARSQSPRPRHRGEGARESQFSDSGREAIISPPQAVAVANEDMIDAASDLTSAADSVARMQAAEAALEAKDKDKAQPTFEYSGKLAAETNKVKGVTLQFTEPPEARKPSKRWRLYVFKDGEALNEPLYIHRQTCYLFGRERRVADIPTDHPSCSKQHAVIQYRLTEKEGADGMMESKVRPYIMDLGSTNGTFLNAERIDAQRYYELFETDTIKFGNSSREYVVLHENSTGAGL